VLNSAGVVDDEVVSGSTGHSWPGQTSAGVPPGVAGNTHAGAIADRYARISYDADLVEEYTGHRVKIVHSEDYNIRSPPAQTR
jgi:hypothetical protein